MPVKRVIDRHLVVDDMFGTNSVAVNLRFFAEDIRGIYKIEGEIHEKIIDSEVWASRHIKFFVICGNGLQCRSRYSPFLFGYQRKLN